MGVEEYLIPFSPIELETLRITSPAIPMIQATAIELPNPSLQEEALWMAHDHGPFSEG